MRDNHLILSFLFQSTSSILIILLGIFVILSGKPNTTKIVTFLLAIVAGFSHLLEFYLDFYSYIFDKITYVSVYGYPSLGALIPSLLLHFHLVYPSPLFKLKKHHIFILYLPSLFFIYISLNLKYIYNISSVNYKVIIHYTPFYLIYGILVVVTFLISLFILLHRIKHTAILSEKKHLKSLLIMELVLAVSSVLGYNARFIFGREINIYDISLVLFFGVIAYGIVKYQAFNIKTAVHYSLFWFLSAITIFTPIIVIPLLFHNTLNNIFQSIFASIYAILSIGYYILNQIFVFPFLKKNLFRRNIKLNLVVNSFRTDIENVNSIDSFKFKLSTLFSSILFSKNVHILLSDTDEKLNINDAEIDINLFNWISFDKLIINRAEIVDYAPKNTIFDNIHLIIKLNFNDLFIGYILLDEKYTLKGYNYEEISFIEQVLPSINTAIYRINIIYKSHEIELVNNLKTSFFINLAHETRTPATLIQNYICKCVSRYPNDKDLLVVQNNIDKLVRDMVNFLDTEKIEQGRLTYDICHFIDLSHFIIEKLELLQPTVDLKHIEIIRNIQSNLNIYSNVYALDRILNNLIDNAIKYTPDKGKIYINLSFDNNLFVFQIIDNGPGIPEDKKLHIFEKYYQISHSKQNSQGIGMGLFITKSIIENLHGDITFNSSKNGTSFQVVLPNGVPSSIILTPAINTVLTQMDRSFSISNSFELDSLKSTILIVEDNIDLLSSIKDSLEPYYNILCALNGKEALAILNKCLVDLIISDIMMDQIDGYELLELIRKNDNYRTIPFVFLTSKSGVIEEIRGLSNGAIDYIQKPFSMDSLKARVIALLKYSALTKKVFELEKFKSAGILTANICHEIMNPLSGIKGPLFIIERNALEIGINDDVFLEGIEHIKNSVNRISNIVNTMRSLFHGNSFQFDDLNLYTTITPIVDILKEINGNRIKFNIELSKDIFIKSNLSALTQILMNILSNAIESISGQGSIVIYEKSSEFTEIIIQDSGCGISKDNLKKIFDFAFTTKSLSGGTGLGLYIVKELSDRLNITVVFESEMKIGTTVILRFNDSPLESSISSINLV